MTTGIEWTDETWNPIAGPGQPYEGLVKRVGGESRWTGEVRFIEKHLTDPLRWRTPRRVFVNSMSDLFHERVTDEQLDQIFAVMALAPQHTFQVLTKRPERMRDYLGSDATTGRMVRVLATLADSIPGVTATYHESGDGLTGFRLPNVWLGVSCEHQEALDERVPLLLETPAAVRFISAEPLLGPIDFRLVPGFNRVGLSLYDWWVIVGGESGKGARPCNVGWIRSIVEQCRAAMVPVFVKQLGSVPMEVPPGKRAPFEPKGMLWRRLLRDRKGGDPDEWPEDLRVREMPRAYQRSA